MEVKIFHHCTNDFIPRVYSFKDTYFKIYVAQYNWLGHYAKIPADYTTSVPEQMQSILRLSLANPVFHFSIKRSYKFSSEEI